jgi:hypothetical protein
MHLDRRREGELITGQVRAVATLMNVTEATARTYLGDEIITGMARRMLFEVVGERPGADLMEALRTVPLPLALVGITVAALAKAMQVRAANEPPDRLRDVIATSDTTAAVYVTKERERAGPGGAGCSSTPGRPTLASLAMRGQVPRPRVHVRTRNAALGVRAAPVPRSWLPVSG